METVTIEKVNFVKILNDVERLIQDVEVALSKEVNKRITDIETNKIQGKTEKELDEYLKKRGVKIA
ncbi:MAG: hypothetical protein AABX29_04750 [Nanoarchaeota archaeon]